MYTASSFLQNMLLCVQASAEVQLLFFKGSVINQYTERASENRLHNLVSSGRYT